MNPTTRRRAVIFSGVIGYAILGLVHPRSDPEVGDSAAFFIGLHVFQPVLIVLLAWGLWLLVDDLPGRAAAIVRIAVFPFAIVYTMFDTLAGIAVGLIAREGGNLPVADQAAAARLLENLDTLVVVAIAMAALLTWLVAVLAAAVAVRTIAPLYVSLLIGIGGAVFAAGHPFPTGPIGMGLMLVGIGLLEFRYRRAPASKKVGAVPALQP
jgi:hypothetical protein